MLAKWLKRIAAAVVAILIVAATVYALWPKPVAVDVAVIDKGPLEVTVDEEGTARIRDVFRVSAPISGRLDRLPVHLGDRVFANTTEVATIRPTEPAFLDVRTRREFEATVAASEAGVDLAKAQLDGALTTQRLATSDLDRAERLAKVGAISLRAFEQATAGVESAAATVEQAKAELELRKSELTSARARLIEPDQAVVTPEPNTCCLSVRSPVSGIVLKMAAESEQVVAAGTPLVEIGDPRDMEVVVHLLSGDAVTIAPGTLASVDGWGGPSLSAVVNKIEPAAYTKVSALGIEEQRVDATLYIADPHDKWKDLGHGFRVMVHIATWQSEAVVRVPLGALFRRGNDWNVYRVVDGAAALTPIVIDHRNAYFAEVLKGLAEGDAVVVHPSDSVADGVSVVARETGGG